MLRLPCKVSGLVSLLLVAFLVRLTVALLGFASYEQDPDSYARLACGLAQSGVFGFEDGGEFRPTAFRPPLYPWILSWLVYDGQLPAISVALLHLTLGMGTVWLTYSIARTLRLAWPCLAGFAVTLDPLLLRDSQLVMTETLAAFLAVVVWRLWLFAVAPVDVTRPATRLRPWSFVALGLAFGISILARPTAAPWAVLCAVALLLVGGSTWRIRLTHSALVCLAVLACIGPWTFRNLTYFDKPVWATTHGGYTLLLANNRELYAHFRANGPSRAWDAEPFHSRWSARIAEQDSAGEVALDQIAYVEGIDTIQAQPVLFMTSCVYRVGWLWALWPNTQQISLSAIWIAVWYVVFYVLAFRGAASQGVRKSIVAWIPALALLVSLTAVHAVFWSNMRMRAPMMSVIYLLAAVSPLPSARGTTILNIGSTKP